LTIGSDEISVDYNDHNDEWELRISRWREETDAELQSRIDKQKQLEKDISDCTYVHIFNDRYQELLEIEAMYKNLCK